MWPIALWKVSTVENSHGTLKTFEDIGAAFRNVGGPFLRSLDGQ